MTTFNKATMVGVEVKIGSGHVAVYTMTSDEYIKLRQLNALGLNNCFLPDEEGVARWAARTVNHYTGLRIDSKRLFRLPTMTTKIYQGRWMDFEVAACEALGIEHYGYKMAGKVKGYIPDGVQFGEVCWEFKSSRGQYRKKQVQKIHC